MATKANIEEKSEILLVKVGSETLQVPSSNLPKFADTVQALAKLEDKLAPIKLQAQALEITDAISFAKAGSLVAELKASDKEVDLTTAAEDRILERVKNFVKERKLRPKNLAEQIRGILEPKMKAWKRAEEERTERERREAQAKIDAENARLADEKRQADQAAAAEEKKRKIAQIKADHKAGKITTRQYQRMLEQAGDAEEAKKAQIDADAEEQKKNPPKAKVESNVPTVTGVRQTRTYTAKCIDRKGFLQVMVEAYASGDHERYETLSSFVVVKDELLAAEARSVKDSKKMEKMYPCIEASDDYGF